jgi:tetratricopeptide (TPR) repeat protein
MSNAANRLALMQNMLEQDPNDAFLKYAIALEYKAVGQIDPAITSLQALVVAHPDYLPTYYQLGEMLVQSDKLEEAIKIYLQGRWLAKTQQDHKTLGEINEALLLLDYEEE